MNGETLAYASSLYVSLPMLAALFIIANAVGLQELLLRSDLGDWVTGL